jgi:hypothetical protein
LGAACCFAQAVQIKEDAPSENSFMARHSRILIASALAFVVSATLVVDARALERRHHRHWVARGGDIVVYTGRSYLDPGTSAEIGSENHYFSDSVNYGAEGPDFTSAIGGFELLPSRFNPPGRPEPLFQY